SEACAVAPRRGDGSRRARPRCRRGEVGLVPPRADSDRRRRARGPGCSARKALGMRDLPVPGTAALSGAAVRTGVARGALAVASISLVLLAAAAGRHPQIRHPESLPVRSGDLIVLDLSASISSDTFSRIGQTLRTLVASGGRYGLVVFSNVAYEALPPGSP